MSAGSHDVAAAPRSSPLLRRVRERTLPLERRARAEACALAVGLALAGGVIAADARVGAVVLTIALPAFAFGLRPGTARRVAALDAHLRASGALVGTFEALAAGEPAGLVGLAARRWERCLAGATAPLEVAPRPWVGMVLLGLAAALGLHVALRPAPIAEPFGRAASVDDAGSARSRAAVAEGSAVAARALELERIEERLAEARAAHERGELDDQGWREALRRAGDSHARLAARERAPADAAGSRSTAVGDAVGGASGSAVGEANGAGGESSGGSSVPNPLDARVPLPDHLGLIVQRYFAR